MNVETRNHSDTVKNDRAAWLHGPSTTCSAPPGLINRVWRLVLLGAPGVGKGTQAALIAERLRGCHLSTGDVFRAAACSCGCAQTPAMTEALSYMKHGDLVPDPTVWNIIRERSGCFHCRGGFVLDGFPRTIAQAQLFQKLLKDEGIGLDAVLDFELLEAEIIERLSGRRVCSKCKAVYHETRNPPQKAGLCDACCTPLTQREDDRPEAVKVRLETYHRDTAPLIDFYRDQRLLISINANSSPDEVFDRTLTALETAITDGLLRSRNPRDAIVHLNVHGHGLEEPDEKL
jgi:adenylate kinase